MGHHALRGVCRSRCGVSLDVPVGVALHDDRVAVAALIRHSIGIVGADQLERYRHGATERSPVNTHGHVGRDLGGVGRHWARLGEVDTGEPFAAALDLVAGVSGPGPHGGAARLHVHGDRAGVVVTVEAGDGVECVDLAQLGVAAHGGEAWHVAAAVGAEASST